MAAQLMATKRAPARGLRLWMRAGHHLLARAALARDEDRRGRGGDLVDHAVETAAWTGTGRPASGTGRCGSSPGAGAAPPAAWPSPLEPLQDHRLEALGLDRLGQVVVDAAAGRLDRAVDGAVGGEDDEGGLDAALLQIRDQLQPGPPGELQVGDDEIGR